MIDRRELLAKARERGLPLAMVEKDYVLGWALFAITRIPELVFKGGTALDEVLGYARESDARKSGHGEGLSPAIRLTAIAPLSNMMGHCGPNDPCQSRHRRMPLRTPLRVNKQVCCPLIGGGLPVSGIPARTARGGELCEFWR